MKNILIILFCFNLLSTNTQAGQPKLSPLTKKYLMEISKNENALPRNYVYKTISGNTYVSALIRINNSISEADLNSIGIMTGTKAGRIWTVQVPADAISDFVKLSGIDYIQLDEPSHQHLDFARIDTRVDSVHSGINLPIPYNGEGVVVGIIDAGFDLSSPAFFDTTGVGFRVKKTWFQKNTSGIPPAGFAYGTELADSGSMWNVDHDNDGTHATHVGGIAAGSGFGGPLAGRKFRGVAYKSDLVFVGITPDKPQWINTGVSDMIDGISFIYDYATSVNKPCIVNLSWGSPLGPRDGTGLFSEALDFLTGEGRIFACSAGNNGENPIHIQKSFHLGDTVVETFLEIEESPEGKKTWVDIWGDTAMSMCARVSLYNNGIISTTNFVCLSDTIMEFILPGSNNDTCNVSIMTSTAEFNMQPRIFLDFDSRVQDSILISVTSNNGTINMWNSFVSNSSGYYGAFSSYGNVWATDGNSEMTISDIASSMSAITVGAYASKVSFVNTSFQTLSYSSYVVKGDLNPFSSRGPAADGRVKPDITGPGLTLGSTISSYDSTFMQGGGSHVFVVGNYMNPNNSRNYPFAQLIGTSMSSPAVSGIVALMLQVDNYLTPQDVKDIFSETAIVDGFTGSIPPGGNNSWGNGKVNAYGAVIKTIQNFTDIDKSSLHQLGCNLFPNPNSGNFIIDFTCDNSEKLIVEIFDMTGKNIFSDVWLANAGYNFRTVDVHELGSGIYFTKISSDRGQSIFKMTVSK